MGKNGVVCPVQEADGGFALQWLLPSSEIAPFCDCKGKRVWHGVLRSLRPVNRWAFPRRGEAFFSVDLPWWREETWLRAVNVSIFGLLCGIRCCWGSSRASWSSPACCGRACVYRAGVQCPAGAGDRLPFTFPQYLEEVCTVVTFAESVYF